MIKAKKPRSATGGGLLAKPNVSWRFLVPSCVIWCVLLTAVFRTELGAYLEARLALPVDFWARELLHESPEVSSKLKLYAVDDSTFAKLGTWVLSLEDWSKILKALAANKPRAIFIDAMFSRADDLKGDLAVTIDALKTIGVPVVVGSFVTRQEIRYREPLELARARYDLASMLGAPAGSRFNEAELPPLVDARGWYAYGAAPELQPVFAASGHILYGGNGKLPPLVRLTDDEVLPHISHFLAKDRRIERGHLILDGMTVPIDALGQVTVNFPPLNRFYERSKSMKGLLQLARDGRPSKLVEEGDVVLIIPHMYTGNTDFKMTPFGYAPGGFVIASMLNSVLTGQWLKPLSYGESLIVAAVLLGAFLALRCGTVLFWVALTGTFVSGLCASLFLFAFQSVVLPWLMPAVGFLGSGIAVFAAKMRASERKALILRQALEGSVPEGDLQTMLKKPELLNFEARERVVTLMFVDVVGFSLLAENMLPRMAFDNLKRSLATISDMIHSYGGIIDKTLGDGLLCYFGYRFDSDSSTSDHAEQALRCAIRIQEENLRRNIECAAAGDPVYPLRIGINTASCYLGDLGSGSRIDFTVVGNGVNFAKRLEGACEMHSVLVGATTNDLVTGIGLPHAAFTKRFIRIKHHSELVESYEYDPFYLEPQLRQLALEGFRKCANIERVDQRWPVHDSSKFQLSCDFGDAHLVNFSHAGLSIRLPQLLAKGTRMNIVLDAASGTLKGLLAKDGIDILQGEVRWGYAEGGAFVHGVMLTNVSDEQSDRLIEYLCEFAFSRDVKKDHANSHAKAS